MLNEGCKTHDSSMIDADHEFLMKYLFVTMNVEEINDYIDDDNVSRY